jgi:hypothetical protein
LTATFGAALTALGAFAAAALVLPEARAVGRAGRTLPSAGVPPQTRRLPWPWRAGVAWAGAWLGFQRSPGLGAAAGLAAWGALPRLAGWWWDRRRRALVARLPDLVEFLELALAAGKALPSALAEAPAWVAEPLRGHLARTVARARANPGRGGEVWQAAGEGLGADGQAVFLRIAAAWRSGPPPDGVFAGLSEALRRLEAQREKARTRALPLEFLGVAGLATGVAAGVALYLTAVWAYQAAQVALRF